MDSRPILYLIDGHAVAYRQYFALRGNFSTSKGEQTNATYGFTRILLDILEHNRPKYLAVSFDEGLSGREEYFTEYKANREEMPDSLRTQIQRIHQLVEAFNIPLLTKENTEADDVMGTIARQAEAQDIRVHIVTGDRDILQLLSDKVRVQLPKRGETDEVFDIPKFREKYGLEPHQLIDLKALMGDSSDNIPGVKGIGEKTGVKLLQEYGTLENLYEHIAEIKGTNQTKLIQDKDMAFLSQRLATIIRDIDIELEIEKCVAQDFDFKTVDDLFAELEFRQFRDRLKRIYAMLHPSAEFESEKLVADETDVVKTIIVQDEKALKAMVAKLESASLIAFDTETTSIDQMAADIVGISLAVDSETGYYIPVGHVEAKSGSQMMMFAQPVGKQLPLKTVIDAIRPAMTNPNIAKVAHNAIYDMIVLQRYGIDVYPVTFDTMIAEWVSNPISKFLGLKNLVRQRLDIHMTEISDLLGSGKNQKTMDMVEIEKAAPYAAADAALTLALLDPLKTELEQQPKLVHLLNTMEIPLIPVVASIQSKGVLLDLPFLQDMSKRLAIALHDLEENIYENSGGFGRFNINSPKQLNDVLFETLKLPVEGLEKTSHGYSTNVVTLEALSDKHPIVDKILEYRELSKLQSTYVDALPQLVNAKTGRVHTSYNQTGSATGRFSSSNPNLQNIPIRTELGREVRGAFIAPAGHVLLSVDYSQIELRVMAHMSEDETLIRAFQQGLDIHRATAATVNGIDPEEVTYEQRSFAKRVNFGLMYGMGAFRLTRDSDLTLAESKDFIKTYFERMPGVERYIEGIKEFVHEHGYTETLYGRRRDFPALKSGDKGRSAAAEERAAINMPIQGTAADILKQAMLNLHARLQAEKAKAAMILQVHDELVLEVEADHLDSVTALVIETMESAFPDGQALRVPIKANASYGLNWRDMEDLD